MRVPWASRRAAYFAACHPKSPAIVFSPCRFSKTARAAFRPWGPACCASPDADNKEHDMRPGRYLPVIGAFTAVLAAGPALAQEPIKIGVTQPLTGAFAASGNYV